MSHSAIALVREHVPEPLRKKLLGHFVSEELADSLDRHYVLDVAGDHEARSRPRRTSMRRSPPSARRRLLAQKIGALALVPFIAMLIWHGIDHNVPLFLASFAGFFVALLGIINIAKNAALWRCARPNTSSPNIIFSFPCSCRSRC